MLSDLRRRAYRRLFAKAFPDKAFLEERLEYLLNEVSDLRMFERKVRALLSEPTGESDPFATTKSSFSYQWSELKEGAHLLGDPNFEREMFELASCYVDLPAQWFKGKKVLDAGCGIGRWSYVLSRLGADVIAVDQSASGIEHVKELLRDQPIFKAQQADLLSPLPWGREFDLVWCYGVTHHTGDTRKATEHVAGAVKPGGRLFLMIYGEPVHRGEFSEVNTYVELRRATASMPFEERVEYLRERFPDKVVHGYFDAISPVINDLHRFDEIRCWLVDLGFVNVRSTLVSRNHHIVADLPEDFAG